MTLRSFGRGVSVYAITIVAAPVALAAAALAILTLEYLLKIDNLAGTFLLMPPLSVFLFIVLFSLVARLHRWQSLRALAVAAFAGFGAVLGLVVWLGWFPGGDPLFLALVVAPLLFAGAMGWLTGAVLLRVRFRGAMAWLRSAAKART